MVLEISKISYENLSKIKSKKSAQESIHKTNSVVNTKTIDKSCNGKFDGTEAAKNFGKGLVSPITSMFSSKKNFLIGAGMIIGGALLIAATGGAAAPLLIAVGVGMGAVQAGKAAVKIAKAKDGDDIEKAFYDVGGATGTIGLSLVGAKSSLKQANIATEGLNTFGATAKCFKSAKTLTRDSVCVFKTGHFKANLANSWKRLTQSKKIRQHSKEIHQEAKKNYQENHDDIASFLPDELKEKFHGRTKSEISINDKINKEIGKAKREIEKALKDETLSAEERTAKVVKQKEKIKKLKEDKEYAKSFVLDSNGYRTDSKLVKPQDMDKFTDALIAGIKNDKVKLKELKTYRGPKCEHYISDAQIERIKLAGNEKGYEIKVTQNIRESGYSAVQMNLKHKNGSISEFQLRGDRIDKVANWEHIPYDLSKNKDLSRGNNKIGILLHPVKKAIGKLTEKQFKDYTENYVVENYAYEQKMEFGLNAKKPTLPEGINPILSAEKLEALYRLTRKMPSFELKKPFIFHPQLPLLYTNKETN